MEEVLIIVKIVKNSIKELKNCNINCSFLLAMI